MFCHFLPLAISISMSLSVAKSNHSNDFLDMLLVLKNFSYIVLFAPRNDNMKNIALVLPP